MTKGDKIQAINDWLEENLSETIQIMVDINCYDGTFADSMYYDMARFDEMMDGLTPTELAERIFFGDFNPMDDYFYFNGYGNLCSSNAPMGRYTYDIAHWILRNCEEDEVIDLPASLAAILNI